MKHISIPVLPLVFVGLWLVLPCIVRSYSSVAGAFHTMLSTLPTSLDEDGG